jgi:SnoaL-like domain
MKMTPVLGFAAAASIGAIFLCQSLPRVAAAPAVHANIDLAALVARAEIEDMLTDYYAFFGNIGRSDWGSYYVEDAVFDVNGIVRKGRGPINALYKTLPEGGNIHILISNQRILVKGDGSATASFVWTEVDSKNHLALPQIVEQGHEQDDLVKRDGRWYFAKRVVTNDGGLPATLEKSYRESGRGSP